MTAHPKIFIGSDHRGFALKQRLLEILGEDNDIDTISDLGPESYLPDDDYNDYVVKVAEAVLKTPNSFGILICGSAIGVSIQANRFKGIRAAIVNNENVARITREHNNANIICLSAEDFLEPNSAITLIKTFIKTPFSNEERHIRRIKKLDEEIN